MKRYVFGPLLLDPQQQVLFEGAERVTLAPKTFDLLLVLVENAGQVVSREALRDRVWSDSFVEEALISKNVSLLKSRLRPYLGDNGFIETVPKRGYRFNVDVQTVQANGPVPAAASPVADAPAQPLVAVFTEPDQDAAQTSADLIAAPHGEIRARRWPLAVLFGVSIFVVCLAAAVWHVRARHREPVRLTVLDFRNLADAPDSNWIGVALQESLLNQLSAEGGLPTVSGEDVAQAERDLGLSNAHSLTETEREALGRRVGAALLLTGTYIPVGDRVRVDFGLWDTREGKLTEQFSDTVPLANLAEVIAKASGRIRSDLKLPAPPAVSAIRYFSQDAVAPREYAEGLRLARSGNAPQQARDAFSKAVEADPNFAEAHLALAQTLSGLGYTVDARQQAQRALDTSTGIQTERERLSVQAQAYRLNHDYARAAGILTSLHERFPADSSYTTLLAQTDISLDREAEALALLTQVQNADKDHPDPMLTLMRGELMQMQGDRKAELFYAGEALKQAQKTGSRTAEGYAYMDAGSGWHRMEDDEQAMANYKLAEQVFSQTGDRKGVVSTIFDEASTLKDANKTEAAEPVFQRALSMAEELNDTGMIGSACINLGFVELDLGHPSKAVSYFQESLHQGVAVRSARLRALSGAYLVYAYLRQGDVAHAQATLADQSPANQPDATIGTSSFTALSQARIDAYLGKLEIAGADYKQALTLLRQARDANHVVEALQEYSLLLLRKGEVSGAQTAFGQIEKGAATDDPYSKLIHARILFASGDVAGAEAVATAALKNKSPVDSTAFGDALMSDIAVQRRDWNGARRYAHQMDTLALASPEDTMLHLDSVRQAAFVAVAAGDPSSAALRILPEALKQAENLRAAAEVASMRALLARR